MSTKLSICTFMRSESLAQSLEEFLSSERYILHNTASEAEFLNFIEQHKHDLDCVVLQDDFSLLPAIKRLYEQGTLLPVVIFPGELEEITIGVAANHQAEAIYPSDNSHLTSTANPLFHAAEVRLSKVQPCKIGNFIDQAIASFIELAPEYSLTDTAASVETTADSSDNSFLMQQQQRLSDKLRERLGYLGVYYKRNPRFFFRNLSEQERQKLLENLRSEYRQIVLSYFSQDESLNRKIDEFVDQAFFADISVSRIVEIHMELMDEFSKHLKLEGRSDEVLLDYRLTLIDVIAHLGEMYRRSIPREL
ncbi:MAG: circadian clock protein KaiA [Symploca sp. SIO1C4]|uniref:Circadian clock oscillator protein KaiA n=1 Tax=Symploca sp. SIO1C4 TaxID=2607765 RepID=A0A6B3NBX0_9CYAN|nr:circadian clock protein KaiA [Symploca sp. SIO1C4]